MNKPSEKAMRVAAKTQNIAKRGGVTEEDNIRHAAEHIDAFAAEALSEHKRVLDECERALASTQDYAATLSCTATESKEVWNDIYNQTTKVLAAIAELKTNEKLNK